jgi:hypothetical protein
VEHHQSSVSERFPTTLGVEIERSSPGSVDVEKSGNILP